MRTRTSCSELEKLNAIVYFFSDQTPTKQLQFDDFRAYLSTSIAKLGTPTTNFAAYLATAICTNEMAISVLQTRCLHIPSLTESRNILAISVVTVGSYT
jgi:hypothetical protein